MTIDIDLARFAEDLRVHRARHRLTLDEVAARTGLCNPTISRLERGLVRMPGVDTLARLCALMGVEVNHYIDHAPGQGPASPDEGTDDEGAPESVAA